MHGLILIRLAAFKNPIVQPRLQGIYKPCIGYQQAKTSKQKSYFNKPFKTLNTDNLNNTNK